MATLTHSYNVGYRGLAKRGSTIMLCTGGNINVSQDPIMSGGVWGAGEGNISPIAYAWNYLTLDGSMNVEITNASGYWQAFYSSKGVTLYPDGNNGYNGDGYNTTTSVEASEGSAVTGTYSFKDSGGGLSGGKAITDTATGTGGKPSYLSGDSLVPYWRTTVGISESNSHSSLTTSYSNIISWSASSNRDVQFLKCCNLESSSPHSADYVVMGEITGDCSFNEFGVKGSYAYHQQHKGLTFLINIGKYSSGAANYDFIGAGVYVPIAIINSSSQSMSTGSSYVSTEYSFTAIGDTTTCGVSFF